MMRHWLSFLFTFSGLIVITPIRAQEPNAPVVTQETDADTPKPAEPSERKQSETPAKPETEAKPQEAQPPGRLPWEKDAKRGPAGLQGFRNAREMLKFLGVESSEFEAFFQNEPLTPAEEDVLFKLLYFFPRLGLEDLHRWRKDTIDWVTVGEMPNDFRGDIFRLQGRAKSLRKMPLIPEVVDRYEFDHYYQIEVEFPDAPFTGLICSRTAPARWKPGTELDEPISVDAMFLKIGEEREGRRLVVFAAQRIRWRPEKENAELQVGAAEVKLARQGFDVGLLSELAQANYQGLGPLDREPFYALLASLAKAPTKEFTGKAFDEPELIELLLSKTSPHGQPYRITGNARKIVRVRVDDADIRERYGIDHYYQVDFFLPLDKAIKIGSSKKPKANAISDEDRAQVYANGYPATICLLELPPAVKEGDNLRQSFVSEGIFYKMWSYPLGSAHTATRRQLAPMFLASSFTPVDSSNAPVLTMTDLAVFGGLALGLVLFGAALWWAGNRKKPGQGAELVTGSSPVTVSVPEDNA